MTWRFATDDQRGRLYAAKTNGGLCAACGRPLDEGEPVYIEPVAVERKPLAAPGARWRRATAHRDAPLGAECASGGFLAWTVGREPERCEGCGRPVYYAKQRAARQRASCSVRCSHGARWPRGRGEGGERDAR